MCYMSISVCVSVSVSVCVCVCVCVCERERERVREKKIRIYRWCNWKQESWLLMWYRSSLLHSSISTRGQSQYVTHRCRTYKTHSPHWSTLHLIYTSGIISFEQWPDQMRDWVLSVSFALVSCSQTFRLAAEGLGTLAALNGQGPPKRPWLTSKATNHVSFCAASRFGGVEMSPQ